ncbi:hypothetical protein SJAV_09620 [Sulfurisphaera javensis]|uniref:Polymerase nucleotidyl transferase domain-containing protein n=1 Tax=Sulfurisphaera javensis TaxID=2049879 RepID=A0AAT9GQ34_9CREN
MKVIKEACVKKVDLQCKVILFGSVVRGNFRIDSDVDVLVITKFNNEWERQKFHQFYMML